MSLIEIKNLSKQYGAVDALQNVNLTLESGRIVGLLGPNGSGKTTLIKIANGLLQPSHGELIIDGHTPGIETKKVVSYLPDTDYLPEHMRVSQLMTFYADFYKDFNEKKAIALFQDLGIAPNMRVKSMSKGTKEKVQLILTMSREAKVYLLDEPIGGVDPAAREYILRTIINTYNKDAVVIISTHLIADIETVLDDVIFIKNGNIVLHQEADVIREERGMSIDGLFREVFRC